MTNDSENWSPLYNLPDAPEVSPALGLAVADLARLAALCPHGWVELMCQRSTGDEEGELDVEAQIMWGVGPDIAARMDDMLADLVNEDALKAIAGDMFIVIARVTREREEGWPGWSVALDVGWGANRSAVYSLPPTMPLEDTDDPLA